MRLSYVPGIVLIGCHSSEVKSDGMLSLTLLAALLSFQQHAVKIYDAPIDDGYNLRAEASYFPKSPGVCCTSLLRVLLVDRLNANRYWEITAISDEYEHTYTVKRADRSSIVVEQTRPDYGVHEGSFKLFFDVRSKRLLKKIDFNPAEALKSVSTEEAQGVGLDPAVFVQIKNIDFSPLYSKPDDAALPVALRNQPFPQSTYRDFARARPNRVRDGYDERSTIIGEKIGPHQVVNGRIWFGKTFGDGEGGSGVGGLGYFDIDQNKFTFLQIPEVSDWSVSALLVENETVWAGLVSRGENAVIVKGLLRHDLKTSGTQIYRIEDAIKTIVRSGNRLLIGTTNGIYVLNEGGLIRHRVEPTMDGKFALYTERL